MSSSRASALPFCFAALGLLAAPIASAGPSHAFEVAPELAIVAANLAPPVAKPKALPKPKVFKRDLRIRDAVKKVGAPPPTSVPAPKFKLSPDALKNEGAYIRHMGRGELDGVASSFILKPRTEGSEYFPATVTMHIPTEDNKTYVVDCDVRDPWTDHPRPVAFRVTNAVVATGDWTNSVIPDDDHALFVFRASETESFVTMKTGAMMEYYFYSCEITKVD